MHKNACTANAVSQAESVASAASTFQTTPLPTKCTDRYRETDLAGV